MPWDVIYSPVFTANTSRYPDEFLAPRVVVSINRVHSDNSRIPRTQLSFQDESRRNSYTRSFEWECELWDNWELILTNPTGDRISLSDALPGISSWIWGESPVSTVGTHTSAQVHELTKAHLAQSA